MTSSFTTRPKPITPFSTRGGLLNNVYNLVGKFGGIIYNIKDVNGNQIVVRGPAYSQTSSYSVRIKP